MLVKDRQELSDLISEYSSDARISHAGDLVRRRYSNLEVDLKYIEQVRGLS